MTALPDKGISVELRGAVAAVTIRNVARKNALTMPMWSELARIVDELGDDPSVAVLVVSGAGDNFSTGVDLSDQDRDQNRTGSLDQNGAVARAEAAVINCPKPVIAAIRGYCVGGGLLLALACDLRLASANSRFAITPAKIGAVYPARSIARLVSQIGPSAAKMILYTAEMSDAAHAFRIGLVDEVTDASLLDERAFDLAASIAGRSQLTVQAVKDVIETSLAEPAALDEREALWQGESAASAEQGEGLAAFAEKRPPQFRWRAPSTSIPRRTYGRRD